MKRPGYFEIAQRNDGWVVRWKGGNHAAVLSSSDQLYATRRGAENAILSVARAFWDDGFNVSHFFRGGPGALFVSNGDGDYVEVREVDER